MSFLIVLKNFVFRKKTLYILPFFFFVAFIWFALLVLNLKIEESIDKKDNSPHITIPPTASYVPDQIVIRFRREYYPENLLNEIKENEKGGIGFIDKYSREIAGVNDASEKLNRIENELRNLGATTYEKLYRANNDISNSFYLLTLKKGSDITTIQRKLKNLDFLKSSEPNFISTIASLPNDPLYKDLWGMKKIQAPEAWDISTISSNVTVAVLDTGVSLDHPDLKDNLIKGVDIINGDNDPSDEMGHGTHVAGIIGAVGNNNLGVTGVNWRVKIMPIRVCNEAPPPLGSICFPADGIYYAVDNGAKIINLSVGLNVPCVKGSQYQEAIDYAVSRGVIVVGVAGNNGTDASSYSPASCSGVITVGATTINDSRALFSNYGPNVSLSAPGEGILSTWLTGEKLNQGTSMAGPHVAGAAALILSKNPSLSPQQVRDCLINQGDAITTDFPIGKRLNVFRSLATCSLINGNNNFINIVPTDSFNNPKDESSGSASSVIFNSIPTPTLDVIYDCSYGGNCNQGQSTIQLCSLECVPRQ